MGDSEAVNGVRIISPLTPKISIKASSICHHLTIAGRSQGTNLPHHRTMGKCASSWSDSTDQSTSPKQIRAMRIRLGKKRVVV